MDFPLHRWKIDQLRDVAAAIGTATCLVQFVGDSREGMLVRHGEGRGHACAAIGDEATHGAAHEIAARRSLRPCSGVERFVAELSGQEDQLLHEVPSAHERPHGRRGDGDSNSNSNSNSNSGKK
ncbi:hypothetical protein ACFV5G_13880 [Streptomyces sp. NPDC059766]|uniref:hypothetical protein n=1 Tax=Streptomyces sp. NPDC059766 TaxID=3346940 RepID=UPI003668528A